jgi:hypothetical protein
MMTPSESMDIRCPKIPGKDGGAKWLLPQEGDAEQERVAAVRPARDATEHRDLRLARIDRSSIKSVRLAAAVIAQYFRREFGYDSPLYQADESLDPRERIYLLTVERDGYRLGVGVICFRWRDWENMPEGLSLTWLWIHPYLRGAGILSSYWDLFRELHGDFPVEPPVSKAMKAFLTKRNECWKCGRTCNCEPCSEA